jgi:hypothetical protein
MLSIGLWRWYINITVTILDIIHLPVFLKHNVSETGFCLRLLVETIQFGPIDRASLCLHRSFVQSLKNRNHRSGHLKTKHTERLLLLRRHLWNWYRGPAVSKRSELLVAWETWTVSAAVSISCARLVWEIHVLSILKLHHSFVYVLY